MFKVKELNNFSIWVQQLLKHQRKRNENGLINCPFLNNKFGEAAFDYLPACPVGSPLLCFFYHILLNSISPYKKLIFSLHTPSLNLQ